MAVKPKPTAAVAKNEDDASQPTGVLGALAGAAAAVTDAVGLTNTHPMDTHGDDEHSEPETETTATGSDANVDTAEPIKAEEVTKVEDGAGVRSMGTDPAPEPAGGTSEETARERDSSEDPSNIGDSVTNRSNDGATMQSSDQATGDNNSGEASTKAGDAPVGVKSDIRPTGTDASPETMGAAMVGGYNPAATMHAPKTTKAVGERVVEMLKEFGGKPDDTAVSETTNIHDAGLLERANIVDFAKQINSEFDISVSVSECQNWLLTRDIVNTVLRKLAKQ